MQNLGSHPRPTDFASAILSRSPSDSFVRKSLRSAAGLGLSLLIHLELWGRSLDPERDSYTTPFPEPPKAAGSAPKSSQPSTRSWVGAVLQAWVPPSLLLLEKPKLHTQLGPCWLQPHVAPLLRSVQGTWFCGVVRVFFFMCV